MAHSPGYSGYVRFFQREYVTHKDARAHKYSTFAPEVKPLAANNRFTTMSSEAYGPDSRGIVRPEDEKLMYQRPIPRQPAVNLTIKQHKGFYGHNDDEEELKKAFKHRPTHNWTSTYNTAFDGFATSKLAQNRRMTLRQAPPKTHNFPPMYGLEAINMLKSDTAQPTYIQDFGANGQNPLDRFNPADGVQGLSERASTNDLFAGTNKGTVRLPGYSGYVPRSVNNKYLISGQTAKYLGDGDKSNLVQTYRHDMPGYTGHHPQSVVNDCGPRTPAGKRPLKTGLHASIIVASMK